MSCLDCGSLLMVGTDRVCNVCRDINALMNKRRPVMGKMITDVYNASDGAGSWLADIEGVAYEIAVQLAADDLLICDEGRESFAEARAIIADALSKFKEAHP